MASLTAEQMVILRHSLGKYWTDYREDIGLTKPELYAAVEAINTYFDDSAAAMNNALPAVAKANLTARQKAKLTAEVLLSRYTVEV